jgi:hypothetical protein
VTTSQALVISCCKWFCSSKLSIKCIWTLKYAVFCFWLAEEVRRVFPTTAIADIHHTMRQKMRNSVKSLKRSASKTQPGLEANDENAWVCFDCRKRKKWTQCAYCLTCDQWHENIWSSCLVFNEVSVSWVMFWAWLNAVYFCLPTVFDLPIWWVLW